MVSEESIHSFPLYKTECFGPPKRSQKGMQESGDGQNRTPLSFAVTIRTADIVVNGERPLICPHIVESQGRVFCNAWVGVATDPKDENGNKGRYSETELLACINAYRVPNPPPAK